MATNSEHLKKPLDFEPLANLIAARDKARCDGPIEWFQPGPMGVRYALFGVKPGARDSFEKPLIDVLSRFD